MSNHFCEILVYDEEYERWEECGYDATVKSHGHWLCERHADLIAKYEIECPYVIDEQFEEPSN